MKLSLVLFCSAWAILQLDCISHSTSCCGGSHAAGDAPHPQGLSWDVQSCWESPLWELGVGLSVPQRGISQQNCFYFQRTEVFTENIDLLSLLLLFRRNGSLGEVVLEQMVSLGSLVKRKRFSQCFYVWCVTVVSRGRNRAWAQWNVVLVVYSAHWGVWKWSGLLSVEFFWRRKASFGCLFKVLHCEGVVMVDCNVSPVCLKAACKQSTVLHRMCAGKEMQHKHYPERSWGEQAESCEPFLYVLILLFFAELLKALNH